MDLTHEKWDLIGINRQIKDSDFTNQKWCGHQEQLWKMKMSSFLIKKYGNIICAMVKTRVASVALAFTWRGCYGWWGACLTDRAMTCVRWYVCSFCGKPWRFCDTLPPLLAYCLHLVPYNSVTRVRCQLEMPLPIVIFNFLICRWLLSWFLVMSELTPLSNVLSSNWVSGAQSQPDLRFWYSMDPAVSRA